MGKFLPTLVKRVGKIIFYLVPTRLLGPTRLLNSKEFSHLHAYWDSTLIRHLRVCRYLFQKTSGGKNSTRSPMIGAVGVQV